MSTLATHLADTPLTQATAGGAKAALPSLAVLRVSGEDARAFLHAQFTADLKRLNVGCGGPAAWCSPKGRVLFLCDVLNAGDDGWLLLAPATELPALMKRLRMYMLRAKVVIDDLSDSWSVMGLAGDSLPAALDAPGAAFHEHGVWLLRVAASPALAYAFGPHASVIGCWDALGTAAVDAERWASFEIDAMRPCIAAPLGERFLPQELDLERLQGVHFDKGCYPGQEIVARLKYRGQVKAGLHRAQTTGAVTAGDKIYRDGATASVGDVLRVATSAGACRVLAVLDFDAAGAALHLRDAQGPALVVDA